MLALMSQHSLCHLPVALAVCVHDAGEQRAAVGRGVGNGVRARGDGLADRVIRGAAGGDDGDLGMTGAERGEELRPAAMRASVSCVAETMVATTGMSMCVLMSRRISAETGALSTTP